MSLAIRGRRDGLCRSTRSTRHLPVARRPGEDIGKQVDAIRLDRQDADRQVGNTRNDMYLASEAIRFLMKDKESAI
jgi:hypothetical protein